MTLPNQLTLLRILLTPIFVLLLFIDSTTSKIASFLVFIMASLTDWYDGYTARKSGDVTMWGQFLDPLADKILISSAFICFSILGYVKTWMVLVIVIRDFLITGLRSYAVIKGKPIVPTLFAKAKTFGQFGILFFIFILHLLSWQKPNLTFALMVIITLLTVVSGMAYLFNNRAHLREMAAQIRRIFVPSNP